MAEPIISYLYQRYKSGTRRVTDWLVNAASERRSIADILNLPVESKMPSATGKKKRNKQKKLGTSPPVVKLSADNLLKLAAEVKGLAVQGKPPADIQMIIKITEDVVRGRLECAQWYHVQDRDTGHSHFTDVMRELLQTLRQSAGRTGEQATLPAKQQHVGHRDDLSTKFSSLSIEEPTLDSFESSSSGAPPRKQPAQSANSVPTGFVLETPPNEDLFALYCCFKEAYKMRTSVRAVWTSYQAGSTSLATATQVSCASAALMKQLITEFSSEFPHLASFDQVAEMLKFSYTRAGLAFFFRKLGPGSDAQGSSIDLVSSACLPAYTALGVLRQFFESERSNDEERTNNACLHAIAGRPMLYTMFNLTGDLRLLLEDPAELQHLGGMDEFTLNFIEFFCEQELTLAVVMIFQLQMDVHDILGPGREHIWKTLFHTAQHVKDSIAVFRERQGKVDGGTSDEAVKLDLTDVQKRLMSCIDHGITKPRAYDLSKRFTDMEQVGAPLLAALPLLEGFVASRLIDRWHIDSIRCANYGSVIPAIAHLYRACRVSGVVRTAWKDMETVVDLQGPKTFGLLDYKCTSTTWLSAARVYGLANGVRMTAHSREQRKNNGGQPVRINLPPSSRRPKHYMDITSTVAYNLRQKNTLRGLHQIAEDSIRHPRSEITHAWRGEWEESKSLDPDQLILLAHQALKDQELGANFDYLRFSATAWEILIDLELAVGLVVHTYDRGENAAPPDVCDMVDDILWKAAQEESNGQPEAGRVELGWLQKLRDIFEKYIGDRGSESYDAALAMSSDHLADHLVPKAAQADEAIAANDPDESDEAETTLPEGFETPIQLEGSKLILETLTNPDKEGPISQKFAIWRDNHEAWKAAGLTWEEQDKKAVAMVEEQQKE